MNSFDPFALMRALVERLSDRRRVDAIDTQIDHAMKLFSYAVPATWTESEFVRVVVDLVQHLHLYGLTPGIHIPAYEALAEARRLLAVSHRIKDEIGYDPALADVLMYGTEAMKHVVGCMCEVFREQRKQHYRNWTIESAIGPLDWNQRMRLVDALAGSVKADSASPIPATQLAQLDDCLFSLLADHIQRESYVSQFLSGAVES